MLKRLLVAQNIATQKVIQNNHFSCRKLAFDGLPINGQVDALVVLVEDLEKPQFDDAAPIDDVQPIAEALPAFENFNFEGERKSALPVVVAVAGFAKQ